jgi:hypothetical protein
MPVADGLVVRNVAAQARPPRARRVEMHTWTAEQLGTFLAAVRAEPKRAKGRRSLILASLDTYSQVIPSLQQEAASVVGAAVLDRPPQRRLNHPRKGKSGPSRPVVDRTM